MEPLGNIIHRIIGKDQKKRRRLVRLQTILMKCLKGTGIEARVTAVRGNTIFLRVDSQVDKSEIESFYQEKIIEGVNEELGTARFEKVKVKVEK